MTHPVPVFSEGFSAFDDDININDNRMRLWDYKEEKFWNPFELVEPDSDESKSDESKSGDNHGLARLHLALMPQGEESGQAGNAERGLAMQRSCKRKIKDIAIKCESAIKRERERESESRIDKRTCV